MQPKLFPVSTTATASAPSASSLPAGTVTDIQLSFPIDFIKEWLNASHQMWTARVANCSDTEPSCSNLKGNAVAVVSSGHRGLGSDGGTVVSTDTLLHCAYESESASPCHSPEGSQSVSPASEHDVTQQKGAAAVHDLVHTHPVKTELSVSSPADHSSSCSTDISSQTVMHTTQPVATSIGRDGASQSIVMSSPSHQQQSDLAIVVTQSSSCMVLKLTSTSGLRVEEGHLHITLVDMEKAKSAVHLENAGEAAKLAVPVVSAVLQDMSPQVTVKRKRGRPRKKVVTDGTGVGKGRYSLRGKKLPASIFGYSDSEEEDMAESTEAITLHMPLPHSLLGGGADTDEDTVHAALDMGNTDALATTTTVAAVSLSTTTDTTTSTTPTIAAAMLDETMHPKKQRKLEEEKGDSTFSPQTTSNGMKKLRRKKLKLDVAGVPKFNRRKRNNLKLAECKYCHRKFCDYTGVSMHVKKFHGDRPDLQHEDKEHYKKGSFPCTQCGKMWPNVASLKAHVRTVHLVQGKQHACSECPAHFKWTATLKQHVQEVHGGSVKGMSCDVCGKTFYRRSQLNRHMTIHRPGEFECTLCGRQFGFLNNLHRHTAIVHPQEPAEEKFHCSYCGKGFFRKAALISHVEKVHFSLFPYNCSVCKTGFPRAGALEKHMVSEHKEVGFKAPVGRRPHFKYNRGGQEILCCSFCGGKFHYKTQLMDHIHSTHGDTFPCQCHICQQGFLEQRFLIVHLWQAHQIHATLDTSSSPVTGEVGVVKEGEGGKSEVNCYVQEDGTVAVTSTALSSSILTTPTLMDAAAVSTSKRRLTPTHNPLQPPLLVVSADSDAGSDVIRVVDADQENMLL
ncbi:hypothetical protein BaRGS_00040053, partial [Batillaria attramentaria]